MSMKKVRRVALLGYGVVVGIFIITGLSGCGAIGPIVTGGLVGGSMGFRHDGGAPVEYR